MNLLLRGQRCIFRKIVVSSLLVSGSNLSNNTAILKHRRELGTGRLGREVTGYSLPIDIRTSEDPDPRGPLP